MPNGDVLGAGGAGAVGIHLEGGLGIDEGGLGALGRDEGGGAAGEGDSIEPPNLDLDLHGLGEEVHSLVVEALLRPVRDFVEELLGLLLVDLDVVLIYVLVLLVLVYLRGLRLGIEVEDIGVGDLVLVVFLGLRFCLLLLLGLLLAGAGAKAGAFSPNGRVPGIVESPPSLLTLKPATIFSQYQYTMGARPECSPLNHFWFSPMNSGPRMRMRRFFVEHGWSSQSSPFAKSKLLMVREV